MMFTAGQWKLLGGESCDPLCPHLLSSRNVHVNPFILKKKKRERETGSQTEDETETKRVRETDLKLNPVHWFSASGENRKRKTDELRRKKGRKYSEIVKQRDEEM